MTDYPKPLGKTGSDFGLAVADPQTHYPSVHLDECDLPDSGTITFRYRVCREMDDKKAGRSWTDLDLIEIVSVKADKKSEEYGGDALDKIKAALDAADKD